MVSIVIKIISRAHDAQTLNFVYMTTLHDHTQKSAPPGLRASDAFSLITRRLIGFTVSALLFWGLMLGFFVQVKAQCVLPTPAIGANSGLCEGVNTIENATLGADSLIWDWGLTDFSQAPSEVVIDANFGSQFTSNGMDNTTPIWEDGSLYVFVTSSTEIIRLDFGNAPTAPPTYVPLGNPGGALVQNFGQLEMVPLGDGRYRGIIAPRGGSDLILYDFADITDTSPTVSSVDISSISPSARGTTVLSDANGWHVLIGSEQASIGTIGWVTFRDSVTNPSPILRTIPATGGALDLASYQTCDSTYVFLLERVNRTNVSRLTFADTLSTSPDYTLLGSFNGWHQHLSCFDNYGELFLTGNGFLNNQKDLISTASLSSPGGAATFGSYTGLSAHAGSNLFLAPDGQVHSFALGGGNDATLTVLTFAESTNGLPGASIDSLPNLSFPDTTTVTVGLTAFDALGRAGKTSATLQASPNPTADFSFLCSPSVVAFENLSTPDTTQPGTQYLWDFGDGSSSNAFAPTHTFAPPGPYDVNLSVTTADGCTDDITKTVSLTTPPTAGFSTNVVCANDSLILSNTSTAGSGVLQPATWIIGQDTVVSSQPTLSYWPQTAGELPLELLIEDDNGCTDRLTDTVGIAKARLDFEKACDIGTYQFVPMFDYPLAQVQFAELDPDNGLGFSAVQNAQSYDFIYDVSGAYNPRLVLSTNTGCMDTIRIDTQVAVLNVTIGQSTDTCQNAPIAFSAGGNFNNYVWDFALEELSTTPQAFFDDPSASAQFEPVGNPFYRISIVDSATRKVAYISNKKQVLIADLTNGLDNPVYYPISLSTLDLGVGYSSLELVYAPEHSQWIGFIVSNGGTVFRLRLDSLTDNNPAVTTIDVSNYNLQAIRSAEPYLSPGGIRYLIIGGRQGDAKLVALNLGDSWLNMPQSTFDITTGGRRASALSSVQDCDGALTLLCINGNAQLYALAFDDSLTATPNSNTLVHNFSGFVLNLNVYSRFGERYIATGDASSVQILEMKDGWSAPPTATFSHSGAGWAGVAFSWQAGDVYGLGMDANNNAYFVRRFSADSISVPSYDLAQNTTVSLLQDEELMYAVEAQIDGNRRYTLSGSLLPKPVPKLSFGVLNTTLCANDNITLAVQDTNSVLTGTSVAWAIDTQTLAGDTVSVVLPFNLSTPVNITATATNGCTATLDTTLEVRERPQAGFDITSAPCATGAVTFEDTSVYTSGSISVSTWNMGIDEQLLVNPGAVFDYEFINPGAKVVTLTALGDNGCADTVTQMLPLPSADFELSQSCAGVSTDVLPSFNYPGDNITGYDWTLPGGVSSTQPTPPSFTPPEGQAIAQLIVNTQNGCEDTILRSFSFAQPPEVQIELPEALCADELLAFVDNSTATAPTVARQWTFNPAGDVFNSSGSSQTYSFDAPGNYDVQLAVTLEGGCSDSSTTSFSISPNPVVMLPDTVLGCSRQPLPVQLDSLANGGPDPAYLWFYVTDSGTFFSALPTPAFLSDSALERRVQLELTNDAGCSATDSTLLIFRPAPMVSLAATPTTGNVPIAVQFTPTASAFDSLLWRFTPTDSLGTTQDTTQRFTMTQDGPQVVQLIAFNPSGCTDTARATLNFAPEVIGIWDVILLELIPDFNTDNGQLQVSALVENNSNLPLEQLTYDLRVGEVSVTDSFNFAPIAPGSFTTLELPPTFGINPYVQPAGICLTLSAPNGFTDTDTTNNRLCITLGEGLRVDAVYPSPFREALTFRAYTDGETLDVTLFDVLGQSVGEWQFNSPTGTHEHTLDLLDMAEGVYYLRLRAGESEHVRAVVKR